jgi:hypothetical protein
MAEGANCVGDNLDVLWARHLGIQSQHNGQLVQSIGYTCRVWLVPGSGSVPAIRGKTSVDMVLRIVSETHSDVGLIRISPCLSGFGSLGSIENQKFESPRGKRSQRWTIQLTDSSPLAIQWMRRGCSGSLLTAKLVTDQR